MMINQYYGDAKSVARQMYNEEGAGIADNPFNKVTQTQDNIDWSFEIHRLWNEEFQREGLINVIRS